MDGEENLIRNDINKYKWKFFGSLTDIGAINYVKDTNTNNFALNSIPMPADPLFDVEFDFQGPSSFVNSVLLPNSTPTAKQETKFRMNLPTTLHLGADYNIHKNWYASANMSRAHFSSLIRSILSLLSIRILANFSSVTPPPATTPSAIAALVAFSASSIFNFRDFISASVEAPTLITAMEPFNLAILSNNLFFSN